MRLGPYLLAPRLLLLLGLLLLTAAALAVFLLYPQGHASSAQEKAYLAAGQGPTLLEVSVVAGRCHKGICRSRPLTKALLSFQPPSGHSFQRRVDSRGYLELVLKPSSLYQLSLVGHPSVSRRVILAPHQRRQLRLFLIR